MNQYEVVITGCKRLEQLLEGRFGAAGRGLHEKVTSVAQHLPLPVINKLRYIASVRNQVVHGTAELTNEELGDYSRSCQWAHVAVEQLPQAGGAISTTPQELLTQELVPRKQVSRPPLRSAVISPPQVVIPVPRPPAPRAARPAEITPAPDQRRRRPQRHVPRPRTQRTSGMPRLGALLVAVAIPVLVACGVFFLHRTVVEHLAAVHLVADPHTKASGVPSDAVPQTPPAALPVIAPGPPGIHRGLTQRR